MSLFLVGVLASACTVAAGQDFIARTNRYRDRKPSIDAVDAIHVLSLDQAAKFESEIQKAYARLAPSVVRFGKDEPDTPFGMWFGTGVIIEGDGLILTCAHFGLEPGEKLSVELSNGRRMRGVALGRFELKAHEPQPDIGLVRITDKGEYPAAKIDPVLRVKGGEICIAIGYPGTLAPRRPPLLRLGRVLPPLPEWNWVRATTSSMPGDSGGPLFDLDGHVLGVAQGGEAGRPTRYQPLTPFHEHRNRLIAGEIVSAPIALFGALERRVVHPASFSAALDLEDAGLDSRLSTVHVVDGSTDVALGLIVGSDGWIITKHSLVATHERLGCRLNFSGDDYKIVNPAKIVAHDRQLDLALLKIDAEKLTAAPLATATDSWGVGRLVISVDAEPFQFCVIGSPVDTEEVGETENTRIALELRSGPSGEAVSLGLRDELTAELEPFRGTIREGDVVVRLNGRPTPTLEDFVSVRDQLLYAQSKDGALDRTRRADDSFAGDPVELTVRRDDREIWLPLIKIRSTSTGPRLDDFKHPLSVRRNGFPAVFAHDGSISPNQCGGPVVNLAGDVVGLNIARADSTRTLAIPSDVLRQAIDALVARARDSR